MNYYNKIKKAVEELRDQQQITLINSVENITNYLVKAISSETKAYTPQGQQRPRENIKANITNIFKNISSKGKDYLLLKTDQQNPHKDEALAIFCFGLEDRWGELNEGGNYDFIVEVSDRQTYILADFHKNY